MVPSSKTNLIAKIILERAKDVTDETDYFRLADNPSSMRSDPSVGSGVMKQELPRPRDNGPVKQGLKPLKRRYVRYG